MGIGLAADVGVVQGRAGVVAGGAVVCHALAEELEDVVSSFVGFCFLGGVEGGCFDREGG